MIFRQLGSTTLSVSALCLGGNVFGWTCDEPASFAVLDAFVERGGNFIDTADTYSTWIPGHVGGESEGILGRWMAARGNRDQIIIATKVGQRMGQGETREGLSRQHIINSVESSLRRLQTDYIDLYQAHIDDQNTPLEETLSTFTELVQQGKVRHLGASNYSASRLKEALEVSEQHGYARYICLQPPYNLANRSVYEPELEPFCATHGLGVIPYSALASGFLSGKYQSGQNAPATPRAGSVRQRYMNEHGFHVLAQVEQVAREMKATPSQVALAWLLARPSITAPIASATSAKQLDELAGAMDVHLAAENIAALDQASK